MDNHRTIEQLTSDFFPTYHSDRTPEDDLEKKREDILKQFDTEVRRILSQKDSSEKTNSSS